MWPRDSLLFADDPPGGRFLTDPFLTNPLRGTKDKVHGQGADNRVHGREAEPLMRVRRLPGNPIIRPEMFLTLEDGANINGPTLVPMPSWVKTPLGRYYLYFAHHQGSFIRLAYADDLSGPWRLREGGVLSLDELPVPLAHLASPEIWVDEANQRFVMYYHGPCLRGDALCNPRGWSGQLTFAATSRDGLVFQPRPEAISSFYLRVFLWQGRFYGICREGNRGCVLAMGTADPLAPMERGPAILPRSRHVALLRRGNKLGVFFSRVGDCPEHILATWWDLRWPWERWATEVPEPVSVLKPEEPWEGACYPLQPSRWGAATHVRELRDPFVFEEGGRLYLLYCGGGEMGIGIAEIRLKNGPGNR